jgi:succinyl-CoA synthetase beta subunit
LEDGKSLKLFEYEAKQLFSKYGIPTPFGFLATTSKEAREFASKINKPVVVKAQILVAGRGKAGGILFANSPSEAERAAAQLLGKEIKGIKVQSVWIEEKIGVKNELYFGITVDRAGKCYVAVASAAGGMEIEEVASTSPEKIVKISIDPLYGFRWYHARQIAKKLGYSGTQMNDLAAIFVRHYRLALDYDAELAEMNPIVETNDGKFMAADTRVIIDDNALFRHPEFKSRPLEEAELSPSELAAQKSGLAYVKLDGDVGIIGNGAGLVMATLDAIQLYGGRPANFLDVGGGASSDVMTTALDVVLSEPNVKVLFINILGGITRCDEMAKGILEAKSRVGFNRPMVIRLVGTNEQEGRRILTDAGIHVLNSMEEAAKKTVELLKTGGV